MKQQQLSNNDWQLLSEYLDGQISPRDKTNLEKRMQTQVELREGLEELRQTRMILRSATKQRVPRNFTLTPSMVEKVRPKPWLRFVPVLNFASAAAALALVVVMVYGLLPGAVPVSAPAAPAATQSTSLMAQEAAPAADASAEAPDIILWGGGAYGLGGGGDSSPMGGGIDAQPPMMQAAPEVKDLSNLPEEAAPEIGVMEAPPEAVQPAPEVEQPAQEDNRVARTPLEGSEPILGVVPPQEAQSENQRQLAEQAVEAARETQPQPVERNWMIPAVVLGAVALAAALASYLLRRKAAV